MRWQDGSNRGTGTQPFGQSAPLRSRSSSSSHTQLTSGNLRPRSLASQSLGCVSAHELHCQRPASHTCVHRPLMPNDHRFRMPVLYTLRPGREGKGRCPPMQNLCKNGCVFLG
jgi:hypothetical protein